MNLTTYIPGTYKLNLAGAYIQDNFDREQMEDVELDELLDELGLITVRVYSCFRRATKYQIWITYVEDNLFQAADNKELQLDEAQNNDYIILSLQNWDKGSKIMRICSAYYDTEECNIRIELRMRLLRYSRA